MTDSTGPIPGMALWLRWVVATALGWLAGVLAAIVLSDLIVNLFYHKETNLIVGLCMGGCMGIFQVRAVRPWFRLARGWVLGGLVMLAPPFIAHVLFEELSLDLGSTGVRVVFGLIVLAGGLVGALLQARALRPHTARWRWWIGALAVSWGLTLAVTGVVGFMATGVVLGVVGGGLLVQLLRGSATGAPSGAALQA